MAMTHSEGGKVEVDGSGQWRDSVYGLRKRTTMACSKAGVEVMACSEAGDEAVVCSGPGSRTIGGGTDGKRRWYGVSRATEEREREHGFKELLSVVKESTRPKILGRGT
jgi:hypothetical protein